MTPLVRFRFGEFVLSPRQRLLTRQGAPVPLIPKYLDLLHLLLQRRHDAVSKQTIFDHVWSDVVVSDGALSQAVRTLRRTLGDDTREPRFIRTVSRHGYQFVWADVVEEPDDGQVVVASTNASRGKVETIEPLVDRLLAATTDHSARSADEARDVAERLHALGTEAAMASLVTQPNHATAVALMRDARWTVPGAGDVPLLNDTEAAATVIALIRLRLSQMKPTVARRWAGAALAGAMGGTLVGFVGGVVLYLSPGSRALPEATLALAAIGAVAGGTGAAFIGAGLAAAEVLVRSQRGLALVAGGALAGAIVSSLAHLLLRALLDGLIGLRLEYAQFRLGGAIDGLAIGGAAGVGYALATRQPAGGGLAAPTGGRRVVVALVAGVCCAMAAAGLALSGRLLVGGLVHEIARSSQHAQLVLGPLGRLIGEPGFNSLSQTILGAIEGGTFGVALTWGLTRRPHRSNGYVA